MLWILQPSWDGHDITPLDTLYGYDYPLLGVYVPEKNKLDKEKKWESYSVNYYFRDANVAKRLLLTAKILLIVKNYIFFSSCVYVHCDNIIVRLTAFTPTRIINNTYFVWVFFKFNMLYITHC